jgi:hypothetical protein
MGDPAGAAWVASASQPKIAAHSWSFDILVFIGLCF